VQKTFSPKQIERFRHEAKCLRKSGAMTYSKALDTIAVREGFENWSLLMRRVQEPAVDISAAPGRAATQPPEKELVTLDAFRRLCIDFIKSLTANDVQRLCWSGSIWIGIDAALTGKVHPRDLIARDLATDQMTQQAGWQTDSILAFDFNGLAERFVLDDDVDADGDPVVPDNARVMYTTEVGRAELIHCVECAVDGEYAYLRERLNQHLEEVED